MDSRKKIVIAGKLPPPYMGPAIATQIILQSALNERYDLIHLDTKANETLNTLGKWSLKKIFRNFNIYFQLAKICIFRKPDLILIPISTTTTGFIKDSFFILIGSVFRRNILIQLRGSDFKRWIDEETSRMTRMYVKCILSLTEGVIVLGNKLRYLFENFYIPNQIYVVPNGADFDLPPRQPKQTNLVSILYVGNLQPSKGIEDVLSALLLLKTDGASYPCFLNVMGGWRDEKTKSACMDLINRNELAVAFHPPGSGREKFQLLANADIFIFTPREPEGHPWVIVEALAAGLPVISTDRGAITESVLDGQNGFIVPLRSPEAIAEKLKLLIGDEALRKEMGKTSFQHYKNNFTEAKMVENYSRVFDSIFTG